MWMLRHFKTSNHKSAHAHTHKHARLSKEDASQRTDTRPHERDLSHLGQCPSMQSRSSTRTQAKACAIIKESFCTKQFHISEGISASRLYAAPSPPTGAKQSLSCDHHTSAHYMKTRHSATNNEYLRRRRFIETHMQPHPRPPVSNCASPIRIIARHHQRVIPSSL